MTQLIIVIIIVAAAFGAAMHKIYLRFFSSKKQKTICDGCSGCSLKNELNSRQNGCLSDPREKEKWSKKSKQ